VLRVEAHVLPLTAAARAEERARWHDAIGARAFDRDELGPRDALLGTHDARTHALAGRGQRHEGRATVGRRWRIVALAAHGVAARRERIDLDDD
jgi:hypothetical protein